MNTHILPICALGIAMMASGCHSKHDKKNHDSDEPMPVEVAVAYADSVVLTKTYPGHLSAKNEVDLVARVDGYLLQTPYQKGAFVRKGDVLFRIEETQYADAVNQSKAQLQTAIASRDYARQHYAAVTEALKSDAVSRMEVLQAKSNLDQAEASISTAQAALRTANTNLSYCTVRAPFDGHVTVAEYSNGAFLAGAGAPVKLGRIYEDRVCNANFAIEDARYLEMLRERSSSGEYGVNIKAMPITLADTLQHSYTANLDYVAPAINTSTGTLTMQAAVENPYGELRSGMYFTIDLPYAVDTAAILIQDAAISTDQRGKFIYTIGPEDKVVHTPVRTGELVADTLRIVTGVAAGTQYINKALLKVRPGMKVKPLTAAQLAQMSEVHKKGKEKK